MSRQDVLDLIRKADQAISNEDFDALMTFYAEDAALVVQPGLIATGKPAIRTAFERIAQHFGNALTVTQGDAQVIAGGQTCLVIMETILSFGTKTEEITRRATYVFNKSESGGWLCTIDNSYGTAVLDTNRED